MDDKFAKSIDDEQLDEVAGGTAKEIRKDVAFLHTLGIKFRKDGITDADIIRGWKEVGIAAIFDDHDENDYGLPAHSRGEDPIPISRQDAMILAMRKTKKVVDLDDYL